MSNAEISDFSEIYSAYAAGCLDPGFALMVETQAALRPEVQRALIRAEMISGILLEKEAISGVSDQSLERVLDRIDASETEDTQLRRAAQNATDSLQELLDLPAPLREVVLESALDHDWQSLTPGVRRLKLSLESQAEVELYRIEPRRTVPRHSHTGSELTLVVAGGFTDETGHFGLGDISIKGPENTHQPTADEHEVCYALSIREGGLRFTGIMGAIQKVLGQ